MSPTRERILEFACESVDASAGAGVRRPHSARWRPNLSRYLGKAVMDPKEETRLRVRAYLEQKKQRLRMMSVDLIVWEVRLYVPGVSALLDSELRATVAIWRSLNGPLYPLPISAPPTAAESKLIEAVKKGVTTVIEGVDIKHGAGKINLSVSGLTAELKKGDARLEIGRASCRGRV